MSPTTARRRGTSRMVPPRLSEEQRGRLRWLLEDPDQWVLRTGWPHFLLDGDRSALVSTDTLTADQRVAALSWLRQQRHWLYRALEADDDVRAVAPAGWLEAFGLYGRLSG